MSGKYDDIINMPHHVSTRHRPMSQGDRAAQFSPFSALTGYEAALSVAAAPDTETRPRSRNRGSSPRRKDSRSSSGWMRS